jgi:hypothetical protein
MRFSPYVVPIVQVSWSCATIVDVVMTFNSDQFARSLIFCDDECWMCYTFICSLFILSSTSLHARPSWTHHHHIITLQNTTHFNGLATFHNMESRGPFMYFILGMNYEKYSWNSHGHMNITCMIMWRIGYVWNVQGCKHPFKTFGWKS